MQSSPKTADSHRSRCRSAGDNDRTYFIRAGSALNTRPPPDYHQHRNRNHGYTIKSATHVGHTRSQSLNREEGHALKARVARQLSNPDASYNGTVIRARQRTPPSQHRTNYRLGMSEPTSPSLSSSFSHSSYSTPPSSPRTPYFSAESSCSSPVSVSYIGSEGPIVTELEELLQEVEKDLKKERANDVFENNVDGIDLETDIPDWQLERWIRWESLAHRRSSTRDALEQETLV